MVALLWSTGFACLVMSYSHTKHSVCRLPAFALGTVEVEAASAAQVMVASGFMPEIFIGSNSGVSGLIVTAITTPGPML